jgi:hypothetical protein
MLGAHPRAPVELQMEFRVEAVAEVLDCVDLRGIETGAGIVDRAQRDERNASTTRSASDVIGRTDG